MDFSGVAVSYLPSDPAAPREPVRVPRARPGTVTLAASLMLGAGVAGLLNGIAAMGTAAKIGRAFRGGLAAVAVGVSPEKVADLAAGVLGLFLLSGGVGAALAVVVVALAMGVLRANIAARITAIALLPLSLCCATTMGLGTVRSGNGREYMVALDGVQVDIGPALSVAVPSWFTALTAGLGCLQVLGYVVALPLLLLPASTAYFRRRPAAPAPIDAARSVDGLPGGQAGDPPASSHPQVPPADPWSDSASGPDADSASGPPS